MAVGTDDGDESPELAGGADEPDDALTAGEDASHVDAEEEHATSATPTAPPIGPTPADNALAQKLRSDSSVARDDARVAGRAAGFRGMSAYPNASERDLRRAAYGCMGLAVIGGLMIYLLFAVPMGFIAAPGENGEAGVKVEVPQQPDAPAETREPPAAVGWENDFEQGLARSRSEQKPLVLFFEADWAAASADMREGSFEHPSVAELLQTSFVAVRVAQDAESNRALKERYGAEFVPHVVYLDSAGERLRPDTEGLTGPDDLRALLSDARSVYRAQYRRAAPDTDREPTSTPMSP